MTEPEACVAPGRPVRPAVAAPGQRRAMPAPPRVAGRAFVPAQRDIIRSAPLALPRRRMVEAARRLKHDGADFVVIRADAMHRMPTRRRPPSTCLCCTSPLPRPSASAPPSGWRVGLKGTAFTMEQGFYKGRLGNGMDWRCWCRVGRTARWSPGDLRGGDAGTGRVGSRQTYREAVVLGCTEIMLLVRPADSAVPLHHAAEQGRNGGRAMEDGARRSPTIRKPPRPSVPLVTSPATGRALRRRAPTRRSWPRDPTMRARRTC